jgi:hypothetical protein
VGEATRSALIDPGRQIKLVFKEPKERLPYTAEFGDFVDGEHDRRLNATVRILLQPVVHLNEANRRCDDEFTAPCLLRSVQTASADEADQARTR